MRLTEKQLLEARLLAAGYKQPEIKEILKVYK